MRRVAPWILDLARGLHYQHLRGPDLPSTARLIDDLAFTPFETSIRDRLAEGIDWAYILTEDRIAEYLQGPGAIKRAPAHRERDFPWYGRLKIGYRIALTNEAIRLICRG
jgi:hypothetical protein